MTIQIENDLYQELVKYGVDIQSELKNILNNLLKQKTYTLSKEEIAKTVENSQRIEGYEPASKEIKDR
ncbi:hypothetical protein GSY74_04275, partial [Sulfurovum sp. bin170]|uniref:hypothetical protein n=1 Tax=Sulfurovum sp. bin170 TaxID=2695268 RepID=UPI0013DFF88C